MKRALLIAGGTVGGLGAVLSVTPPQLGSQGMTNLASSASGAGSGIATASAASSQTTKVIVPQATANVVSASASSVRPSSSASATATTTPKATVKKTVKATTKKVVATTTPRTMKTKTTKPKVAVSTPSSTPVSTPVSTPSSTPVSTPVVKKVSGTFSGSSVFVNYGTVQVQITVVDGKITDARALQAPSGRSDRFTQYAVPVLRQQTLAAQSANIQGASGASYTSYGWYTSLQVALSKAGL